MKNLKENQFYPVTGEYGNITKKHLVVGNTIEGIDTTKYLITEVTNNGDFNVKIK